MDINNIIISSSASIQQALQQMSLGGEKLLLVIDNGKKLKGVLSDGNIRRFIIRSGGLEGKVSDCYNSKPFLVGPDASPEKIKHLMVSNKIEVIPVVNSEGDVIGIERWRDQLEKVELTQNQINVPVVIMAGGKGTRLDPFTRILPKPLIPIGDKPIIQIIVERFRNFGCRNFFISVNHKANLIKAFFDDLAEDHTLGFLEEEKPLGTGGALSLLKNKVEGPIFVSNCDIIVDTDYSDLLEFHKIQNFDVTIVAAVKHVNVPYGVCTIHEGGQLEKIDEKPTFDYLINSGMYLLNGEHLNKIPDNTHMDFPDLIEQIREEGGSIGVYPVEENAWHDVGQWEEYHQTVQVFSK